MNLLSKENFFTAGILGGRKTRDFLKKFNFVLLHQFSARCAVRVHFKSKGKYAF